MTHAEIFKQRHYRPAGRGTYCTAMSAVIAAVDTGEDKKKWNLASIPTTTNVENVECKVCRELILRAIYRLNDKEQS